jgi:hypothetical protein
VSDTDTAFLALVDREAADLRNMLDEFPQYAEVMRNPSAWRDGARLAVSPDRLLARLWAWERLCSENER